MFEDPKLFRQARTLFKVPMRKIAEIAGEKESSFADAEAGRKKFRHDLAVKGWAALWEVVRVKNPADLTKEEKKKNQVMHLIEMMACAHNGLALDISPDKLLAWQHGKGEITPEEEQRYYAVLNRIDPEPPKHAEGDTYLTVPLTFLEAETMPVDEVIDIVTNEIESSQFFLLSQALNKSWSPEKQREQLASQVRNDPRVKIAGAKAWIAHVEKQRDDLKQELLRAHEESQAQIKELIETYRRIDALEKKLEQERQPK